MLAGHPEERFLADNQPAYRFQGFRRSLATPGEKATVWVLNRPGDDNPPHGDTEEPHDHDDDPGNAGVNGNSGGGPGGGPGRFRNDDGSLNYGRSGTTFESVGLKLQSWITIAEFDATFTDANDCWGYVAPSGREYALIGLSDGTGIVEVTDPAAPVIVDVISGPNSIWRDIKTYGEYAYAVSEGGWGIQVFDLSQIDSGTLNELTAVDTPGSSGTHNVTLDEESGFLYRCGGASNTGLRIYDLSNPAVPVYVGQWPASGDPGRYVHDAQVVTYTSGPMAGKQIAYACSGFGNGSDDSGIDIIDVTDKSNPVDLARVRYTGREYSHQAWLSEDRQYLFVNDELDEDGSLPSVLHVLDVSDPANPVEAGRFHNSSPAITHNVYTRGTRLFAANYRSGLRVFEVSDPVNGREVAFFDTYPQNDLVQFNGLWNSYPYLPSGTIIGSDIEKGLFVWTLEAVVNFPNGRPDLLDPTGDALVVELEEINGAIDETSAMLIYDDGSGSASVPLTSLGGGLYEAAFPVLACGSIVSYSISAQTTDGIDVRSPTAQGEWHTAIVANAAVDSFRDGFETDLGWTTAVTGATSGQWERGTPVNDDSWQYDMDRAAAGSENAYLTQNAPGNTDVDNGSVHLLSPVLDLSFGEALLSYDYFARITVPEGGADSITVELRDVSDGIWQTIEVHGEDTGFTWHHHVIDQAALDATGLTMSADMQLRFTATDGGTQSIFEAGIDNVAVRQASCCPGDCTGGPVAGDGLVDIQDLLAVLGGWGTSGSTCDSAPDGGDGVLDIQDLLHVLGNWGPCE